MAFGLNIEAGGGQGVLGKSLEIGRRDTTGTTLRGVGGWKDRRKLSRTSGPVL